MAALLREHTGTIQWWSPSILTLARELGVWWLFFVGIGTLAVAGGLAFLPVLGCIGGLLSNVVLLGVGAIIGGRSRAIRRAMAARREPFCVHCGYSLGGLSDRGTCPECGMVYSFNILSDFRRDPDWFIKRFETIREEMRVGDRAS